MERDDEITIVEVDGMTFNGTSFFEIHIPINHINFDKNGKQRSSYTAQEVAELFASAVNEVFLEAEGLKGEYTYYVYMYERDDKKKYKIAFRTEDKKVYIRLMTLHRSRK